LPFLGRPGNASSTTPIFYELTTSVRNTGERLRLLDLLTTAYWLEIESVINYVATSVNPDGVRAREVVEHIEREIADELGHAQQLAQRIKELYGVVPGSMDFEAVQGSLQPPSDQTDIVHVIRGVIEAETHAIELYDEIIAFSEAFDLVTQDMVISIKRDEERHLRLFQGFLREYEVEGKA
jgi:bacterioferritin